MRKHLAASSWCVVALLPVLGSVSCDRGSEGQRASTPSIEAGAPSTPSPIEPDARAVTPRADAAPNMGDAASPANDSERAPDAVPPAEPPSKEGPGPGKVCFTTLPTEGQHGGNEDATSFDLAFTTVHVRGGAPVKVLSTMKASDFGDGEIYIKAAPGVVAQPDEGFLPWPCCQTL